MVTIFADADVLREATRLGRVNDAAELATLMRGHILEALDRAELHLGWGPGDEIVDEWRRILTGLESGLADVEAAVATGDSAKLRASFAAIEQANEELNVLVSDTDYQDALPDDC
jgi:hypothetical protein